MRKRKEWMKFLSVALSVAMLGTSIQVPEMEVQAQEVSEAVTESEEESEAAQNEQQEESKEVETSTEEASETEGAEEKVSEEETSETETSEAETSEETSETENAETQVSEPETSEETETEEETTEEETTEEETETETETETELARIKEEAVALAYGVDVNQGDDGYSSFMEDKVVADFKFGDTISADAVYDSSVGYGFADNTYQTEAKGWSGNVYYPREESLDTANASYVKDDAECVAIDSKAWTETESTGYGVFTYENTSAFLVDLYNADYQVEVTFENPTDSSYSAYVKAENISKVTGIEVGAGASKKVSFTACVVDGQLNLKTIGTSSATALDDAGTKTVYVSRIKVTRLATNQTESKPTVFIASDSTVQTYDSYYYPQTGWGQTLAMFFGTDVDEYECEDCNFSQAQSYETENVIVENRAIGGRSSKSYVEEGKLDDLLEDIKPGDYLLVQWGHNDATYSRPNRYVSSDDFRKWMMYYVNGAIQRGATPVLVTPVARYSYTTNADGTLKSFASNFEAYRQVMLQIAKDENVPYVDLTQRSIDVCNDFGIEGAKSLFLHVSAGDYPSGAYAGGATDSTHLQYYGAYKFAQCVADGILEYDETDKLDTLKGYVVSKKSDSVPEKVTGLKITSTGATSVSFSWDAEETAELYYIYRAESDDFKDAEKYSVTSSTKYTDNACEAGKTYYYAVAGFNDKGVGELSDSVETTTKTAGYRFDFNYNNSPTMEGWTGVNQDQMYDKNVGYGWITAPGNGRDRSGNGKDDSSAMADDFCLGAGEFAVDLPNGDYEVTVYAADLLAGTSTIKPAYTAEGKSLGSIACKQALGSCTNTVRVTDGQLNLVVGGTNMYINGMTITALLESPSGLVATEGAALETKYSFLLSFNQVTDAAGYSIYQKGTTDKEFKVVKTFTTEEYTEDELSCKSLSVDLGDEYQYYMTCYTSDATESAPSETITVKALVDTAVPTAPKNLICVSPTKDETKLQNKIELSWDASTVEESKYPVIKYVIYRSDKDENDKGFKEFEKVGESTTTKYVDETVKTNISYYYKVSAMNAGGEGELSKVCKTPVAGTLVRGGRESYSDRALVAVSLEGSAGAENYISATDSEGNALTKGVYLSWRSYEADMNGNNECTTTFDVYCNDKLIANDIKVTNMVYEGGTASDTFKVVGNNDSRLGLKESTAKCWKNQYLELALYCPENETMPDGSTCDYTANDMSLGDLDGDGELELLVKWYPSNAKDNSGSGYTGKTFIDAYDVDFSTGDVKLLWRIDLGVNIRSGAHYTQFQVWDFDCDGKAEVAMKTADGTTVYTSTDGTAAGLEELDYIGACSSADLPVDTVSDKNDYRNTSGYVLDGPEYFTIFNGDDGTVVDTTDYIPERGSVSAWGDAYGNRVDRFLSATAYLDGETPFAVFCRGYYTRTCLTAYYLKDTDGDGVGDKIDTYWTFDTDEAGNQYEAQGNHGLSVNDIDNDGMDEIIYGSLVIDHDGTVKYSTGLGHGDAMHVSDWVSWNDGLEIMAVHEHDDAAYHVEIHDAETGKVLMGYYTGKDTGRGVASDIDPTAEGAEWWSIASPTYESNDEPEWDSTDGEVYSTWSTLDELVKLSNVTPASNATLFWDGDLLSEIQDHTFNKTAYAPTGVSIAKWNYEESKQEKLLYSTEIYSSNGTKGNLGIIADFLGDWREEFIARCANDNSKVRIYTTTIQTDYVVPCLLENLAYREGVAWENVGYNQPANLSYLLSEGLVTAELSEGKVTQTNAEIIFTPANDGTRYGHEIEAYEIYRADADGEYKLIDTVKAGDLKKVTTGAGDTAKEEEEETKLVSYKFDFGGKDGKNSSKVGPCMDEYTEITSESASYENSEEGYGLTADSLAGITFRYYAGGTTTYSDNYDASYAALFDDCAMGWNSDVVFKANVPNGKYDVKVLTSHVSGTAKNLIYIQDMDTQVARFANKNTVNEAAASVEVKDGVLTVKVTLDPNYSGAVCLNGLEIVQTESYEEKEEESAGSTTGTKDAYSYTDTGLEQATAYSYKIAAVVDGKTSFMSRPLNIETAVAISSVETLKEVTLVEGTPIAEGETAASLLPASVKVTTEAGEEVDYAVAWDVSALDMSTVGTYTVYGSLKGYDESITLKVKVIANEVKGYAAIDDITTIVGVTITLPATVDVEYTNTTKIAKAITWDTTGLDFNTIGDYEVSGKVEDSEDVLTIKVHVVDTYITEVPTSYAEVDLNSQDVIGVLPKTVAAKFADEKTSNVMVTWDEEAVAAIDVTKVGTTTVTGKVEGFEEAVSLQVSVVYPAVWKIDFGIKAEAEADGWTGVTVNPKGGSKTVAELGIAYSEEKGYGFLDESAVIQGRQESYTQAGVLTEAVYTDFAIPDGQTFVMDVPNGVYQVELVSGSAYKSTVKATIEGTAKNVGNSASAYTVGSLEVTVEDGQLTCEFTSGATSRLDAIIVRQISADETAGGDEDKDDTEDGNQPGENTPGSGSEENGDNDSSNGNASNESASNDNSSNDNSSNDNSSNESVSGSTTSVANTTTIADSNVPLASGITQAGLPYLVLQGDESLRLKSEFLNKYRGRNLYLMAHLGNGIGFTIFSEQSADKEVKLATEIKKLPNFAIGFTTFHLHPLQTAQLSYTIGVHVNVGSEFVGRTAYIFKKSLLTGEYEQVLITTVNEIGNVAVQTTDLTDFMILVED